MPDTVQGVIMSRIDHLETRQQLVLKTASVLGRDFAVDQVRDIFPATGERSHVAEELRALTERGLLSASDGSAYSFRHGMTREVAYGSLVYSQRRQLHRAAATWLEAHSEHLDALDAPLADHWLRAAGDANADVDALAKAEFYLIRAGAAALRQGAFVEAEDFLGQALACHERLPERDRSQTRELEILRHLGTATFAIRGFGSADSAASTSGRSSWPAAGSRTGNCSRSSGASGSRRTSWRPSVPSGSATSSCRLPRAKTTTSSGSRPITRCGQVSSRSRTIRARAGTSMPACGCIDPSGTSGTVPSSVGTIPARAPSARLP